jgi:two-component system phosphate regulon sensor histidine kinase PhoR
MRRIGWRLAVIMALLVAALVAVLVIQLTRPVCLGNADCVWSSLIGVGLVGLLLAVLLGWWAARRIVPTLEETTAASRNIAAAEPPGRVTTGGWGEAGEMARAFNQMVDQQRELVSSLTVDRERLSTVLDHMADGVLITDRQSTVSLINPAACRLLDSTEKAAIGRSFASVVRHHQLIDLWQRCNRQGTEQVEAVEVGPDQFLQVVVTPFTQKGVAGYLVIVQDLTQVRRLQTMRRDFISNLSHELRTPLASLRAVIETLGDGALNDPPAARRFLARAEREVDTMTQMVEELLELSQIESGKVRLRLSSHQVDEIIRVPVERLRSQVDSAELGLFVEVPEDLPEVMVDSERMQQVVANLLHNAIKFTPAGGEIHIRAYLTDDDSTANGEVCVEVEDSGIGIAKRDLGRIFERFYKSDRARTRAGGGTGLGLAIARHIVQAHGGRIWVRSKEGRGSTFSFTMPLAG